MNVEDLKKLMQRDKNKLGAFGNYIVETELRNKGHEISGRHGDLKDLCVDGVRTDVKSTAQYIDLSIPRRRKVLDRKRVQNTDYVHLSFNLGDVDYYEESGKYGDHISYETVIRHWDNWPHKRKNVSIAEPSLSKEREKIKIQFREELEKALGYRVYVVRRELEVIKGTITFSRGPGNLSLDDIKLGERLFVYIQFIQGSKNFGRGTAFTVKDVQEGKFPMTYSWGGKEFLNKKIVVTEEKVRGPDGKIVIGMWGEKHKYPMALFAENMTLVLCGLIVLFAVLIFFSFRSSGLGFTCL